MRASLKVRSLSVWLTLAGAIGLWGCRTEITEPEASEPTFYGTWAGEPWEGDAWASFWPSADTLYIRGTNPVGADEWNLYSHVAIRIRYEGTGTYELGPGAGTFTLLLGGDGIVGRYGTTTERSGTLMIVESQGQRVGGVVFFDARDVRGSSPDTSTIRFEGFFEATVGSSGRPSM
jgi:hypothetical protein